MTQREHVVIVGGGFSGTALALQLLRQEGVAVTIVEGREMLGQGVAYGTRDDRHLLNTANEHSSAVEDDAGHFARWLERTGQVAAPGGFSPRMDYGRYLQHSLDDAAAQATAWGSTLGTRLGRRAVDLDPWGDGFRLMLDDGEVIEATSVVLATGHAAPVDPLAQWLAPDSARYLRDPWHAPLPGEIARTDSVLLIGTGLTMVDMALTFHRRGHRGALHAVSRRGLLPRAHNAVPTPLPFQLRQRLYAALAGGNLRALTRAVRESVADAELQGLGWHAVIDALRPLSGGIWQALSESDRRRFLRHLRPVFEVHRHRMAPAPAATLASMLADGRLQLRAGRIVRAADCGDMILVAEQARRGAQTLQNPYRWVINCTGPSVRSQAPSSLESRLVAKGLLRPDSHGLGFHCDRAGVVQGAHGEVPGLYLVGPACRPHSFEHTAIPELRRQAAELAAAIAATRAQSRPQGWMPARAGAGRKVYRAHS